MSYSTRSIRFSNEIPSSVPNPSFQSCWVISPSSRRRYRSWPLESAHLLRNRPLGRPSRSSNDPNTSTMLVVSTPAQSRIRPENRRLMPANPTRQTRPHADAEAGAEHVADDRLPAPAGSRRRRSGRVRAWSRLLVLRRGRRSPPGLAERRRRRSWRGAARQRNDQAPGRAGFGVEADRLDGRLRGFWSGAGAAAADPASRRTLPTRTPAVPVIWVGRISSRISSQRLTDIGAWPGRT